MGTEPEREYHYQVDAEGRVFHDGTEVVDAPTLRFFVLAMQRTADDRWLVVCQGERNWFHAEGPPLVIQRLHFDAAGPGAPPGGVQLSLAGDYREALDPTTLEHRDGRLYCRVRRGALRARFGRLAMQQLAPVLTETGGRPTLALGERLYPVAEGA
jgi:hypothetical protein